MGLKSWLILLIFILGACRNEQINPINLQNRTITALGHGGMGIGHPYPINTYESIMKCLSLGADGTELDIQMTADSVLVVFHDRLLENSTNLSGFIHTQNWTDICSAVYKYPLLTQYQIIKVEDLFSNIPNLKDYVFSFDCKNFNLNASPEYINTYCNALVNIINKHQIKDNVYLEFESTEFIKTLKLNRPDLKIFIYQEFNSALKIAQELDLQGITVAIDKVTKAQIQIAQKNNILVAVFNTHSKNRNIEAINKNADIIQTDRVKHLVGLLKNIK